MRPLLSRFFKKLVTVIFVMKFSIIIPTQDRPSLLAVVVRYALQLDHSDFEVIVSDNSTSEEQRQLNVQVLREYIGQTNFRVVYPPRVLSLPEHFEFALDAAAGDYITYLTDKMVILPSTLSKAEIVIESTGAEIVNWAYAPYEIDDIEAPSGSGTLTEEMKFLGGGAVVFDAIEALKFKACGETPRTQQQIYDYILGKIIFGCYSRDLISRIRQKSGTLFSGATHDYSAMVQALSATKKCVILNSYGILFISLPRDKSLGSLTATDARWALHYYQSFSNGEEIMSSLLVPGLYSSQHNMVAHDYLKFLSLYGNAELFNANNWLSSIYLDIYAEDRVWSDLSECQAQRTLLTDYMKAIQKEAPITEPMDKKSRLGLSYIMAARLARQLGLSRGGKSGEGRFRQYKVCTLETAVRHLQLRPLSLEWDIGVLKVSIPLVLMWSRLPVLIRVVFGPVARFAKRTLVSKGQ